jgi:adenosylcobinamide-GDP ribazoletransferase
MQDESALSLISGLKNSIAFLTIFPVGMDADGVAQAASYMPLFPFIGAVVGLIVGICVWLLEMILPQLVSAMMGMGLLLLINGVQHMDGLLDFGDGLMFHGSRSGKLKVMRDPTTGAGGFALGLVVLLVTAFSIAAIPLAQIVLSLTVSEGSAVFAMVLATAAGESAHKGMNTIFVEAMHRQRGLRLSLSYMMILAVSFLALRSTGLVVVVGATLTALVMVMVSNRNFGGLTGDVLGATNEIARTVALLLVLVFLKWVSLP